MKKVNKKLFKFTIIRCYDKYMIKSQLRKLYNIVKVIGCNISKVHNFLFFFPLTIEVLILYAVVFTVSFLAGNIVNR